jgi:hypothetical protein
MTFSELKKIKEMLKGQECYKREPTNNQVYSNDQMKKKKEMKNDDEKKKINSYVKCPS